MPLRHGSRNPRAMGVLCNPEGRRTPARVLDAATAPIMQSGEFQQRRRTKISQQGVDVSMLGVSRATVDRRWTFPLLGMSGKLLAVAGGFVGFLCHAFRTPGTPLLLAMDTQGEDLLWVEGWGITLLASAAIASLLRARRECSHGLSPQMRGVFWTCLGGVEAIGVGSWGFVVWLYAAPIDPPIN